MTKLPLLLFIILALASSQTISIAAEVISCDRTINEQYYQGSCVCAIGCYRMYDGLCRPCA